MNNQEKRALITNYVTKISTGTSWGEFQAQLAALPGFDQKDITSTSFQVMNALDAKYGKTIEKQLAKPSSVASVAGLHETIIEKLVKRKAIHHKIKHRHPIHKGRITDNPDALIKAFIYVTVAIIKFWVLSAFF